MIFIKGLIKFILFLCGMFLLLPIIILGLILDLGGDPRLFNWVDSIVDKYIG